MNALSRRGCIGTLGSLTTLGLSTEAQAAYVKAPAHYPATARSVIYIFLGGGLSHVDSFDVKPERPEIQGPMKSIPTRVDGLKFAEPLRKCAKMLGAGKQKILQATRIKKVDFAEG